jgi:small subunit ribosomal protein S16
MLVKIRLKRVGKRKQPSYRVVVADARSSRDGRIIEAIGHYQPRQEPSEIVIDNERALHWLKVGAQPSDQVRKLLEISGAWSEFTGKPVAVRRKPTAAESARKATPAASVTEAEEAPEAEAPEAAAEVEVAVTPEAVDEAPAAPEAEAETETAPEAEAETETAPEAEAETSEDEKA